MAGETKWTPGEWVWAPASEATDGRRSVLLSEARVFTVAGGTSRDIATVGIDRAAEANANARLIAAAPDLYEVVEWLCCQFAQAGVDARAGSNDPMEDLHACALAALARARGETP